mgnify:CR=1 FL=1
MGRGITYHIITIVSVFIALGIGIFIGSMLNGEQLMMSYQTNLIHEFEKHIQVLTSENNELKSRIEQLITEMNVRETINTEENIEN